LHFGKEDAVWAPGEEMPITVGEVVATFEAGVELSRPQPDARDVK
jgi:hypothetical protein